MPRSVSSFFFIWRDWFEKHFSTIWNMVPACLMWLVWQECNARIFDDKERTLDHLKSLLFGTLFHWARTWGCTNCISLSDFIVSISFSSWLYCICFLFTVFTIVNMMFNFFNESLITYKKKKIILKRKCKLMWPEAPWSMFSLCVSKKSLAVWPYTFLYKIGQDRCFEMHYLYNEYTNLKVKLCCGVQV